jgi:type I restriction enzyme S subunit
MAKVVIPVPPLEVQREIVQVLDEFTLLTAELTAELTARKKQYDYYKSSLFNFDDNVPVLKIGDFTRVFSASRVHKKDWREEGVPFWRSSDLISYYNGVENSRGKVYISQELYDKLSAKSGKIEKDDILVTGGGTIGVPYVVPSNEPLYVKDADLLCIKKNNTVMTKYLYHYFLSQEFKDYLLGITHDATIAHYTITQIKDTPVPVPSLEEQERIVNILDKFEELTKSISIGLPAEIDARQKQYEYYRDSILKFKREE